MTARGPWKRGSTQIRAHKALQRRGEVYVGTGFLLNGLEYMALPTCYDCMEFVINLACFSVETALKKTVRYLTFVRIQISDLPTRLA